MRKIEQHGRATSVDNTPLMIICFPSIALFIDVNSKNHSIDYYWKTFIFVLKFKWLLIKLAIWKVVMLVDNVSLVVLFKRRW